VHPFLVGDRVRFSIQTIRFELEEVKPIELSSTSGSVEKESDNNDNHKVLPRSTMSSPVPHSHIDHYTI